MRTSLPLPRQDMSLLKWPALFLAGTVLAGLILHGGAFYFRDSRFKALQIAQVNLGQSEQMVLQSAEEEETIRRYIDHYRELTESGMIGDVGRVELVESIEAIRTRHNLYPVELEINQQVSLPMHSYDIQESPENSFMITISRIGISLSLLHEEDLIRLLAGMERIGKGIFLIEDCSIIRNSGASTADALKMEEHLSASCHFLWLTFKRQEVAQVNLTE